MRFYEKYQDPSEYRNNYPPLFNFRFLIPTICDIVASVSSMIGLSIISPSIWQMLRGARILFSTLLSILFLKRHVHIHNWIGISIVFMGLVIVGLSQYFSDNNKHTSENIILGISATLFAQIFESCQMVTEEILLQNQSYHPLNVVGMEGMWGVLLVGIFFLPTLYFVPGSDSKIVMCFQENYIDAFFQIKHSWVLQLFIVLFVAAVAMFAFSAVSVTKYLSAVYRTLLDSFRTVGVWIVGLVLFYGFDLENYGEVWSYWSYLQLGGFFLMISGSLIYNESVKLPFLEYPGSQKNEEEQSLVHGYISKESKESL